MTGSLTDKVKEKIDTPDARRVPIARGWELWSRFPATFDTCKRMDRFTVIIADGTVERILRKHGIEE